MFAVFGPHPPRWMRWFKAGTRRIRICWHIFAFFESPPVPVRFPWGGLGRPPAMRGRSLGEPSVQKRTARKALGDQFSGRATNSGFDSLARHQSPCGDLKGQRRLRRFACAMRRPFFRARSHSRTLSTQRNQTPRRNAGTRIVLIRPLFAPCRRSRRYAHSNRRSMRLATAQRA
jgi:hypothetical protein